MATIKDASPKLGFLCDKESPYEIVQGLFSLSHVSPYHQENETKKVFNIQGKNRQELSDDYNAFFDDKRIAMTSTQTSYRAEQIIERIIQVLNTLNKAGRQIALAIHFMSNGVMYNILDKLDLKNKDLENKIREYYRKNETNVSKYFEEFFEAFPGIQELYDNRSDFLQEQVKYVKEAAISKYFKDKSPEEFDRFCTKLVILRNNINEYYCPSEKYLLEYFDVAPSTFKVNRMKVNRILVETLTESDWGFLAINEN